MKALLPDFIWREIKELKQRTLPHPIYPNPIQTVHYKSNNILLKIDIKQLLKVMMLLQVEYCGPSYILVRDAAQVAMWSTVIQEISDTTMGL